MTSTTEKIIFIIMKRRAGETNIPIVFMTDYGLKDEYVGVVKCVIRAINPRAVITDITHDIEPCSVLLGAYMIEKVLNYLPRVSVFLGIIDPGVGGDRECMVGVSELKGRTVLFVGPNNGLFTPLLSENSGAFEIDLELIITKAREHGLELYVSNTFHGRDVFGPTAAFLSLGEKPQKIAKREIHEPVRIQIPEARIVLKNNMKTVHGHVMQIDRFGNIITNIGEEEIRGYREMEFSISGKKVGRLRLLRSYAEGEEDEMFCIIGSYRTLEISVKEKSARDILGVKILDPISIIVKF